jgi:hypothetical protein
VIAEASGFKKTQVSDVKVDVGTPASVHVASKPGRSPRS